MERELRLFVGAQLPPYLEYELAKLARNYAVDGVKLVPAANLHLTLLFLGNTSTGRVSNICEQLSSLSKIQTPFTLQLKEISPGPSVKNPRLVWARFYNNDAFGHLCRKLALSIDPEIKLPDETIPHITLARISKNTSFRTPLQVTLPDFKTEFQVNEMSLWQSVLGSPHPTYSVLHIFPFGLQA